MSALLTISGLCTCTCAFVSVMCSCVCVCVTQTIKPYWLACIHGWFWWHPSSIALRKQLPLTHIFTSIIFNVHSTWHIHVIFGDTLLPFLQQMKCDPIHIVTIHTYDTCACVIRTTYERTCIVTLIKSATTKVQNKIAFEIVERVCSGSHTNSQCHLWHSFKYPNPIEYNCF